MPRRSEKTNIELLSSINGNICVLMAFFYFFSTEFFGGSGTGYVRSGILFSMGLGFLVIFLFQVLINRPRTPGGRL